MMTEYRKRCQSMHALHSSSRSPFKRKWDTMATLGQVDKRMRELISSKKRFFVPSARDAISDILRFGSKSTPYKSPQQSSYILQRNGYRAKENVVSGLKCLSAEASGVEVMKATNGGEDSVLRRQYKIRLTETENPELEEYKRNVLAATSTPSDRKGNSNLQLGPTFSINKSGGSSSSQGEGRPTWKELYDAAKSRTPGESIDREAAFVEAKLKALQVTRKEAWEAADKKKRELGKDKKPDVSDAFTRLSREAEEEVDDALSTKDSNKVLVMHEQSNIEITGAVLQCLLPGAWLNDEVINLYMDLLKERELREPNKFLRCHFFNTFFYNKLFKDKGRYDYKAVRRWTTQKKLGYSLLDCDKIFVPVHKDIHWCLAIINLHDQKFEYLDSLKGIDEDVLDVLAKYIVDEAKDKSGEVLDVETWTHEYPDEIPEQMNGCDCGMFMIKYADFHSRGTSLCFTQDDMQYFRRRTVWEILKLRAT